MARTALTVQNSVVSGLTPSFTAANADGHSIVNIGGDVILYVKNGSGGSINVTCQTPVKIHGVDIDEVVVAVGAGAEKVIGPFAPSIFNQVSGGLGGVFVDFSSVTDITVAAIKAALQ